MDHAAHLSGDRFLQQASDATNGHVAGLAGFWKLGSGRALTLRASQAGVLRIAHGRVWATFDSASQDIHVRAGDHFLGRGESLSLRAGESLVIESFSAGHAASAYFSWEPAACAEVAHMQEPSGWRVGVMQPLVDLRAAFGLAGSALGRLARGLVMGAAAAVEAVLTPVALVFVTARARPHVAGHEFDTYRDNQLQPRHYNVLAMSNLV